MPTRAARKLSRYFPPDLHKLPFNQTPLRMTHTTSNPRIHEGRNLKRFREMLGIKQDVLASCAIQSGKEKKVFGLQINRDQAFSC